MAVCPECDAAIEVDDTVEEGQRIDCPECGGTLEVVNTNPIELNLVPEESDEEETESW